MYREEGGHGGHHSGHSEDCGCGGHGRHGVYGESYHHEYCDCGCHGHHGGMGFHRHFVPHEEIITMLEEYLKQLHAEAKGVEEHIAELKVKGESQQS